jgi:hypothetical protein
MRPSVEDFDLLAERAGSARFRFSKLVKYFQKVETRFDGSADKEFKDLKDHFIQLVDEGIQ